MTDDQRLRDSLRDSLRGLVPPPPAAPGRAAGARILARRHRRRTTIATVAGAVVTVAALAVVPALTRGDDPGPRPAAPNPTPSPTAAGEGFACPPPADGPGGPDGPERAAPTGPATVPAGAVAVHLCSDGGVGFDAPDDALTTGVDELARVVNAQPETGPPEACTMDLGRSYLLAFEYADGTVVDVRGSLYGCRELVAGSTLRSNPERPWRRFIALLRDQRASSTPPEHEPGAPGCAAPDGTGTSPVALPGEMVAATLCVRYETATEHAPVAVPVPADDLAVLLTDRAARRDPARTEPCAPGTAHWTLVGRTAWGDLTSADGWCGEWTDDRGVGGAPGPAAQQVLDRLIEQARLPVPIVDASSSAEAVIAAYVDLLKGGHRDGARALWHPLSTPQLPEGDVHIEVKVEAVRPWRTASAYRDATEVSALYREVPADGGFTDYRQAVFRLGRDDDGVLRIVTIEVGEVVPTGR